MPRQPVFLVCGSIRLCGRAPQVPVARLPGQGPQALQPLTSELRVAGHTLTQVSAFRGFSDRSWGTWAGGFFDARHANCVKSHPLGIKSFRCPVGPVPAWAAAGSCGPPAMLTLGPRLGLAVTGNTPANGAPAQGINRNTGLPEYLGEGAATSPQFRRQPFWCLGALIGQIFPTVGGRPRAST